MARLVATGLPLVAGDGGASLREECAATVANGPGQLPESELELARYYLTDQLDDLAGGGTAATIDATVIEVWRGTADLLLAAAGRWSGRGKWLIREVEALDEAMGTVFAARLHDALHVALAGNPIPLVDIADEVLNQVGGRVWAGFRVGASIPDPD